MVPHHDLHRDKVKIRQPIKQDDTVLTVRTVMIVPEIRESWKGMACLGNPLPLRFLGDKRRKRR